MQTLIRTLVNTKNSIHSVITRIKLTIIDARIKIGDSLLAITFYCCFIICPIYKMCQKDLKILAYINIVDYFLPNQIDKEN